MGEVGEGWLMVRKDSKPDSSFLIENPTTPSASENDKPLIASN